MTNNDVYCLSSEELRAFVDHLHFGKSISLEHLSFIIDRASNDWDLNIISPNYFLSIVLEQLIKNDSVEEDFLDVYYNRKCSMNLSIEEFDKGFLDYLFENSMPERRNDIIFELENARIEKNTTLINDLNVQLKNSFDEDLVLTVQRFYEKIYN